MKCFSLLLIILSMNTYANKVLPVNDSNTIVNGEIYTVEIESTLSERELLSFKNKKINDVMYVLEVQADKLPRQFKVFVTNPPKKKDDKNKIESDKEKIIFDMSAFDYKPDMKKIEKPDLFSFESKSIFEDESYLKSIFYGLALLICFLTITFIFMTFKYYQKKRMQKLSALRTKKELLDSLAFAKSRRDLEIVHANKTKYLELIKHDEESIHKFFKAIYQIQYKQIWTDEELKNIIDLKKSLDIEDIFNGI